MLQPQEFKLYDEETAWHAFRLREQLSQSIKFKEGVKKFLEGIHQEEQVYLSQFLNPAGRQSFINVLEGFKKDWIVKKAVVPVKAKTCAQVLLQTSANPLLLTALSHYNQGKVYTFLSYYDYSDGMVEIVHAILGALTELEGKGQYVADKGAFQFLQNKRILPTDTTQILSSLTKSELELLASQFSQDPSGTLFLNSFIRSLADDAQYPNRFPFSHILSYQSQELVLAGAQFGKQIYEALYQIWEPKEENGL